ncbi:227 kDa spindle- and centromere-associated protein [Leptidea sinapis]|nr:227 kDa spindle- and centromere-associated protein [Leptidea sinapis]
MEEVRQLVQEEGREARNLVAFHVAVDTPALKVSRKPPRALPAAPRHPVRPSRLRSASAGRDKRSELRARYWALLFGDLQRAIGEIYNTVEANENLNECQEVILVLENYMRDFKALAEWFRLKWEYDNTPPPQRPQSLAWEIRKTDFVKPEPRSAYSLKNSPSVSGKNSPISGYNTPSGKNSPSLTGKASPGSGKVSPRISSGHSSTSPKANIEFFSNKINLSKITAKPEAKNAKDSRLCDIKEKELKDNGDESVKLVEDEISTFKIKSIEIGQAKLSPCVSPKLVVIKSPANKDVIIPHNKNVSAQAQATEEKLNAMELEFLQKQKIENQVKNDNMLNQDKESENDLRHQHEAAQVSLEEKEFLKSSSSTKSEDNFGDISNNSSPNFGLDDKLDSDVTEKSAYSPEPASDPIICEADYKSFNNEQKDEIITINPNAITQTNEIVLNQSNKIAKSEYKESLDNINGSIETIKLSTEYQACDIDASKNCANLSYFDKKTSETTTEKHISAIEIKNETESNKTENKSAPKPAYSQAAAKPKLSSSKPEVQTQVRLPRSSTVVEIRPASSKTQRSFQRRTPTNKCSYPFNLTTGRTSLFDAPSTGRTHVVPRKPSLRNSHLGSGDAKVNFNKTKPIRPSSLRVNERGDKGENNQIFKETALNSNKEVHVDIMRIESNESIKTLVPDDVCGTSIEVLNVDKHDDDGWLTVKSRRESKKQSKYYWANRFKQPSATASLPTLNMLESPKEDLRETFEQSNKSRAMSEQPQKVESKKTEKSRARVKSESKSKDPTMRRQKSDVTGMKTRSAKNRVLTKKAEKSKTPKDFKKNRLHSSLESLTTGLSRSQESVHEEFDFDKWKAEFKSTFNFFEDDDQISDHNEILKTADPSEMSEIAEMTSQIEENERKISLALDFQTEVDQRKLCEEEDLLNRQILELQQVSDIDLDTETDDTETDAEIPTEEPPTLPTPEVLGSLKASLEDQYETALAGMSWAERIDTLGVLEALVARDPGRAQQLHAKLSQGIKRRGSLQDALRRLQAKQARAERQRNEYQTERGKKIHQLLARVEEVKVAKNQLIDEKRIRMERRLQKAAENRDQHLKDRVRKAHDEEEKLREIAFIKQLEAENRRHEFLEQCRSHTTRLRQMRRDRLTKLEQKAAREAAVGARRQALEAARRLQMESLMERRKVRDARLEVMRVTRRRERGDAAREKAEAVKSRLSALAEAAELEADALRSRIRDKQDASQQRHSSHLQAIREKATGPRQPTTSESQDKDTIDEVDRVEEEKREKSLKKRTRKLKQKILAGGVSVVMLENAIDRDFLNQSSHKTTKLISQLNTIVADLINNINNNNSEADKKKCKNNNKEASDNKKNKNVLIENSAESSTNNEKGNLITNGVQKNENSNDELVNDNSKISTMNSEDKIAKSNEEVVNSQPNSGTSNTGKGKKKKHKNVEKTDSEEKPKINGHDLPKKKKQNRDVLDDDKSSKKSKDNDTESSSSRKRSKKKNRDIIAEFDFDLEDDTKKRRRRNKNSELIELLNDINRCREINDRHVHVDTTALEKLLNELFRALDRPDSECSDSSAAVRYAAVKASYDLLGVMADPDRGDLADQLSTKCTRMAVMVISRTVVACRLWGAQLARTNMCVHLVALLADQLEKDLSDPKQLDLTRQLADCLSVSFDAVLCLSRLQEDDTEDLPVLRSRTHQFITYLSLTGCLARVEKAGEARENIQTLLTVCADLLQPYAVDVGHERALARQSLKAALGTSISGARAEFCVLFAKGATLEQCGGFVRAARTAHLLRSLAEMDHTIVQEAFGEGGWPIEFRAAVARLFSQHAPNDKEAPRKNTLRLSNERLDRSLSESMVLDLIVLVGFVVVNNPQLQEAICEGWSVVKTLCTLPANWLVSRERSHALLPTLIALSESPACAEMIGAEMCLTMLEEFLEDKEAQKLKLVQVIKQGRAKRHSGKK